MSRRHPEQLTQLGWAARRPRTPLKPPGEVRNIAIRDEGDTWVFLTWEAPGEGGEVAVYRIQRQEPRGDWEDVATLVLPCPARAGMDVVAHCQEMRRPPSAFARQAVQRLSPTNPAIRPRTSSTIGCRTGSASCHNSTNRL